ncbi:MAG TPA: DUF5658 family protein [Planctomycetota bacterium]|nr:DUF5658 family protein [Planctomycetota bacterium]
MTRTPSGGHGSLAEAYLIERRRLPDRRAEPTPMLSRYAWHGGRRRAGRRAGETTNIYVDQHGPALLAVVVALTALNFLDAYFTVLFLSYGGQELNPLVDALLRLGPWPFVLAKSLGVGVCAAFLTTTKNFVAARIGLGVLTVGYLALLAWHLYLLMHLPL